MCSTEDFTYLLTFYSTFSVMRAEHSLKADDQILCELIPTPREISSECGFSLRTNMLPHDQLTGIDIIYTIHVSDKGITYEQAY